MRGGSWRDIVEAYPDEDRVEDHGHVAAARQPCAGSRRAVRARPDRCPVCSKRVTSSSHRITPPRTESYLEFVIDPHTAAPAPVRERYRPRVRKAVDE